MLSKVKSCGLAGIDGYIIDVETDVSKGMPAFDIVGLGDTAIKESRDRVRTAIKNSGLHFPWERITVNLAPAHVRKEGSSFDLALAIGLLVSSDQLQGIDTEKYMFVGELSLDGSIKPVTGVLPIAICAMQNRIENIIVPKANADEAAVVTGVKVLPAENLAEVMRHLTGEEKIEPYFVDIDKLFEQVVSNQPDFVDVKGQENVKRALEVAAAGAHNCIMIGSPGSGKTMIAKRLPSILPSLTFEEALEVTKIHSIAGTLPHGTSLITARPFRSPHHTMSDMSLIGGGRYPRPGEVSLAHYGILFLDELPEFGKDALEVLRQPLEDGTVTISRVNASLSYPAKTTLICAANPCKCGYFLEPSKKCTCTPKQVQQYLGKLSGPLLDRIDIHIEVASVKYRDLQGTGDEERSSVIKERVNRARKRQVERYKGMGVYSNSQLTPEMLERFCVLDEQSKALLKHAFERLGLSARAHARILKVARTIADIDESESIKQSHIAEAIQYRSLDRRFWSEVG